MNKYQEALNNLCGLDAAYFWGDTSVDLLQELVDREYMKGYKRLTEGTLNGEGLGVTPNRADINNRLYELENKIEKGTLIELPCKVGDTIYFIREAVHTNPSNPIIEETTIDKIIITKSGLRVKLSCNSTYESSIRNFGKTMFFTKEAAEARLKELEEQK